MVLASLGKLTKEQTKLCYSINQLLASQNTVKDNSELSDKLDHLQMHINSLNFRLNRFLSTPWKRIFSLAVTKIKL